MAITAQEGSYFTSSPSWKAFVDSTPPIKDYLAQPHKPKDVAADRANQLIEESEWSKDHEPATYGYSARTHTFSTHDAANIPVKVYKPLYSASNSNTKLPILFVTHGGGFIQGTAITEERWLIAPLMARLKAVGKAMVVVNVEYRRSPEHRWPCPLQDCEDVLRALTADPVAALGGSELTDLVDTKRIYLAGSSAGACLAALLAQWARDQGLGVHIEGVLLNVPLLCHHDLFPHETFPWATSHKEAQEPSSTLLSRPKMEDVWRLCMPENLAPNEMQAAVRNASPLLQNVEDLPPHILFIAGQDMLRDEGLSYAERLKKAKVSVQHRVYPGVPHIFGEIWSLPEAQCYQQDLGNLVIEALQRAEMKA